jgi:hypothetical protein
MGRLVALAVEMEMEMEMENAPRDRHQYQAAQDKWGLEAMLAGHVLILLLQQQLQLPYLGYTNALVELTIKEI